MSLNLLFIINSKTIHHQPMFTLRPTQQPERLEQPGQYPEAEPSVLRVL